jgi:outer membrane protein OmpA-like peptidoglycan-associated protein
MKNLKILSVLLIGATVLLSGCSTWSKTAKGAVIGTAAGGAVGVAIGQAAGNPALGAIVGAAVGGTTGAIIGRHMDKQAEELAKAVPDATVERVGEGITVEFASAVLFAVNKSDLSTEAKGNLDKLVTVLNTYPDTNIEVQGHTDDTGTETYNQTLSEKRATAVSTYLTSKAIVASRVTTKGYGELTPKYDNTTDEGRTNNRRVEFLITANEKMKAEAAKEAGK